MFQKTIKAKVVIVKGALAGIITVLSSMFLSVNNVLASGWVMSDAPTNAPESFDGAVLNLTNWILGFATMIAVLAIVWGGMMYIGSAGDETKATTGKRTITYAIIGLVIAGIAYALVNIIVTEILVEA